MTKRGRERWRGKCEEDGEPFGAQNEEDNLKYEEDGGKGDEEAKKKWRRENRVKRKGSRKMDRKIVEVKKVDG